MTRSPYTTNARWRRVVLETSLKPFGAATPSAIADAAGHLVQSWQRLLHRADAVGLLLWVADGSEILSWSGDLDQPLEWARYVGFCNMGARPDLYYPGWYQIRPGVPFADDTPAFTYRHLAAIIATLRAAAEDEAGVPVTLGATFDPGPEFAESAFKYREHPEILFDQPADIATEPDRMLAPMHFVTAQATLRGDDRRYGGFPDGIPAGTSLGTFLGRQMTSLAEAVGFDYLWLSNGFGYSHFAWTPTGELFRDGAWRTDHAAQERERTLAFWTDFRAECALPLEVRGSNYSVGMDLATDAADHRAIAAAGGLDMAPPNLPVLHADLLAKDVVTYLTRMAKTPRTRIVYRGYFNDPWFEQNPWYDIYNREPLEVYTALSTCRLNADGGVDTPTDLHLLTIDTERGEVIGQQADEVTPHLLRALEERPDAAGPLVWVYPFDEYHDLLSQAPERLPTLFFHDHFMEQSVDGGLPLLTVCASDTFTALQCAGRLPDSVFVAPAPLGDWAYADALLAHVRAGGNAIVYGPLVHAPSLRNALGLGLADEAIEGELAGSCDLPLDHDTALPLRHQAVTCGGGVREVPANISDRQVLAAVEADGERRIYSAIRTVGEGRLAWLRGSVPFGPATGLPRFRLDTDSPTDTQRPQDWLRALLSEFGYDIRQDRGAADEPVRLFIKRRRGAWVFCGSKPNTTVRVRLRLPDGAPVFEEYDTRISGGCATDPFGKTIYNEVRCFVDMVNGTVKAKAMPFGAGRSRCLHITGCVDARVTVYPDPDALAAGRVRVMARQYGDLHGLPDIPHKVDAKRGCLILGRHTGDVFVTW